MSRLPREHQSILESGLLVSWSGITASLTLRLNSRHQPKNCCAPVIPRHTKTRQRSAQLTHRPPGRFRLSAQALVSAAITPVRVGHPLEIRAARRYLSIPDLVLGLALPTRYPNRRAIARASAARMDIPSPYLSDPLLQDIYPNSRPEDLRQMRVAGEASHMAYLRIHHMESRDLASHLQHI